MITAVFDTNVLLAIAAAGDHTAGVMLRLRLALEENLFRHVSSTPIYDETSRHLEDGYFASRVSAPRKDSLLARIASDAVALNEIQPNVASHPEDDLVIAIAIQERVDYFVTGDRQLLLRDGIESLRIVSPREFLDILAGAIPQSAESMD